METALEILVEEQSMEIFLRGMLPRILPEEYVLDQNCFIRPHQGKSDLQKSLPRKVRAFKHLSYPVKLIVIHDQDANDCLLLKNKLIDLIEKHNNTLPKLVRIACRELENWYLGDLTAIERIYPDSKASSLQQKAKFRDCDRINGTEEMLKLSSNFTKSFAARKIPYHMTLDNNQSTSFNCFVTGIKQFLEDNR